MDFKRVIPDELYVEIERAKIKRYGGYFEEVDKQIDYVNGQFDTIEIIEKWLSGRVVSNDKTKNLFLASQEVERILSLPTNIDLENEVLKSMYDVTPINRKEFYKHMNSLFLKILLDNLELEKNDKSKYQRSLNAREIVCNLIDTL